MWFKEISRTASTRLMQADNVYQGERLWGFHLAHPHDYYFLKELEQSGCFIQRLGAGSDQEMNKMRGTKAASSRQVQSIFVSVPLAYD